MDSGFTARCQEQQRWYHVGIAHEQLVLVIAGLTKEHKRGQGCCIGLGLGIAQALNFDGRSNKALRLDLVKDGVAVPVNLRKKQRDDGM
ncbi:hypothetical protein NL676_028596 [Syzygium grande]|nr:hypothetical protein NL676_028596 [Syzygium grande]